MPVASFPGRRDWGYESVFPYAPSLAYGTPDELKAFVDSAHGLRMMMFLDAVFNDFSPYRNLLGVYAPAFFCPDLENARGRANDFQKAEVRRCFTENAVYRLVEFRSDGLRFDAVHAIIYPDWRDETAAEIRTRLKRRRIVHLGLENNDNFASHMPMAFNAQWNDDMHHVLHVLLTGEADGYYRAYADRPAEMLARCLTEGFAYQGEPLPNRNGRPRGAPSADLPPVTFVSLLQNHDQIGNRALGERLTALTHPKSLGAAIALLLLCPQIPLIFMGEEEVSRSPFLFFTEHSEERAESVRGGRKKEFANIAGARADLPDSNSPATFERSAPQPDGQFGGDRRAFYRHLLTSRRDRLGPGLKAVEAIGPKAIGSAVAAQRALPNGCTLTIVCNLGSNSVDRLVETGRLLFESQQGDFDSLRRGTLFGRTTVGYIESRTHGVPR
jgi:maltooligosyltrehalose trehalohydrolase